MKILIAVLALFLAGAARADSVQNTGDYLIIPDGSTVTSNVGVTSGLGFTQYATFTFADGTGMAAGSWQEGEYGSLFFTTPVSDVSFTWEGVLFSATDNAGDSFSDRTYGTDGTQTLGGDGITEIDFSSPVYTGGIDSISYALDAGTFAVKSTVAPEPGTLALLLMGLVGLTVSRRKTRKS